MYDDKNDKDNGDDRLQGCPDFFWESFILHIP